VNPASIVAGAAVSAMLVAGAALLWRHGLGPDGRARMRAAAAPAALPPWPGMPSDLLLLFVLAIGGAILGQYLGAVVVSRLPLGSEGRLVLILAAYEAGMLGGIALVLRGILRRAPRLRPDFGAALRSGGATLLAALPVVWAVSLGWQGLLQVCGVPVRQQDVMTLFVGLHAARWRVGFILVAAVAAPISEELLFRGGLFRYCRGRMPRWLALLGPALAFGAAHLVQSPLDGLAAFVPLVVLGVIFSLAYERTGRIGTAIVAHALFNLTTIALVLLGFRN
jgi:CAAX protease family protein